MRWRARPAVRRSPGLELIVLFGASILLPAAVLAVVGVRGLLHEPQVALQQLQHRLNRAALQVRRALEQESASWPSILGAAVRTGHIDPQSIPQWLHDTAQSPGGAAIVIQSGQTSVWPERALAYRETGFSVITENPPPASELEIDRLESQQRTYPDAIRALRTRLSAAREFERPWIEHRLARLHFKQGNWDDALARYQALAAWPRAAIHGVPADLIARFGICSIRAARGTADLADQATALYRELVEGRWPLEQPRYLHYADTVRAWAASSGERPALHAMVAADEAKRALARAANDTSVNGFITVASAINETSSARLILSEAWLREHRWPKLIAERTEPDLAVTVVLAGGDVLYGHKPAADASGPTGEQTIEAAGRQWRLLVRPADPDAASVELTRRRNTYVALLGGALALLVFGTYATARVIRRELEIARMKSDFVSTVSHEFRSPLTGIRQLGEMLMRGRVPSEARRQEYYERITRESERLARVVDNLLDFARMEEGRKTYRLEPIETTAWLRDVAHAFDAQAVANGHRLVARIPDALPAIVADRNALTTAVDNLLDNAVKYSPDADTVWFEAECDTRSLAIRVRDRGAGIEVHERERVFERFYRGSGDLTRQVKGTGLGLSLVAHIVNAHGGRIDVDSELGVGSTFTLHLPVHP